VVATVRSDEPCPDAIVSLWKDAGARRLEIGSLDERDMEELVERILGGPVEQAARRWVAQTSRGNALYVRELVLGALADASLQEINELWRLPVRPAINASLRELIAARIAGLDAELQPVLELLALGEPLRLSETLDLAGTEPLAAAEARASRSSTRWNRSGRFATAPRQRQRSRRLRTRRAPRLSPQGGRTQPRAAFTRPGRPGAHDHRCAGSLRSRDRRPRPLARDGMPLNVFWCGRPCPAGVAQTNLDGNRPTRPVATPRAFKVDR
jgi:hypothetical protein